MTTTYLINMHGRKVPKSSDGNQGRAFQLQKLRERASSSSTQRYRNGKVKVTLPTVGQHMKLGDEDA